VRTRNFGELENDHAVTCTSGSWNAYWML
jgi:hypothetical protein